MYLTRSFRRLSVAQPRGPFRLVGTMALALLAVLTPTPPAFAQAVTGAGADATPIPRGSVRVRIAGLWENSDRLYDADSTRPVLSTLNLNALDVRFLPQLGTAQQAIRDLSGTSSFNLSLGTLESRGDTRQSVTPFAFDVGLTSRFAIGLVVPYIETRNNALLILNRDGTSATVGRNPAFSSTLGAGARTANGALLRQIAQARTALSAELARCAVATAINCDAIRGNETAAQQLLQQALATQNSIATLYGDSLRGGSPLVPISNSITQTAINSRIGSLRTDFVDFGITDLSAGALPSPATVINGPGSVPGIVGDTAYGLDYTKLDGTRRAGIGDIDLTATFLWLNTLGSRPVQWLTANKFGLRSLVTAGWRFGTAGADRTADAFDVPIGDGANAALLRSTTDIVLTRWFWMSGTLRLVQPMADNVVMRRPLVADTLLFTPTMTMSAERTLGRRVEVELAPRLVIGRFFGISGGYVFRRADANTFQFAATDSLGAESVSTTSRTSQSVMLGVTFSTLASYVRNRSKWPVEVVYVHARPLNGSGDGTPVVTSDRLELRLYTGFPRR